MERYSLNHLFRMLGCFMLCIMFTATAFAQQKTTLDLQLRITDKIERINL